MHLRRCCGKEVSYIHESVTNKGWQDEQFILLKKNILKSHIKFVSLLHKSDNSNVDRRLFVFDM